MRVATVFISLYEEAPYTAPCGASWIFFERAEIEDENWLRR